MTYFTYDPEAGMEEWGTLQAALDAAANIIACYLDGDIWHEGADGVLVGKVTHRAKAANIVTPDMLDENGWFGDKHYSGNACQWCDYVMMPVEEPIE